jgi:hypothetical protein
MARSKARSKSPARTRKVKSAPTSKAATVKPWWGKLSIWRVFLLLLGVGLADRIVSLEAQASYQDRRIGLHQGKTEARWLYFFISHVYDQVLNPWHWDEPMRGKALEQCQFDKTHKVVDVGAGTGFTSTGVCGFLTSCKSQLTMLDQSTAQLAQAKKKKVLAVIE